MRRCLICYIQATNLRNKNDTSSRLPKLDRKHACQRDTDGIFIFHLIPPFHVPSLMYTCTPFHPASFIHSSSIYLATHPISRIPRVASYVYPSDFTFSLFHTRIHTSSVVTTVASLCHLCLSFVNRFICT